MGSKLKGTQLFNVARRFGTKNPVDPLPAQRSGTGARHRVRLGPEPDPQA